MTDRIGTCSLCGGAVVTSGYMGAVHCISCGAVNAQGHMSRVPALECPRPPTIIEDSNAPDWLLKETVVRRSQG